MASVLAGNTPISPTKYLLSSPKVWLGVLLWMFLTLAIILSLFAFRLSQNERSFTEQASQAYNAVYEKVSINETVLEGFASMLRLSGDSPTIRQYTREMRLAYPHIYSVGFQQYVPASQRESFEQQQRDKGYTDFSIKDFSYEDNREFHEVSSVASYYPTLFGESFNPDAEMVLGLDQFAVPFLKEALLASIRTGKAVATRPFTLAEGGRGYVLYKALEAIPTFNPDKALDVESMTVSMAIKTDQLLRFASEDMPTAEARLQFKDMEGEEVIEVVAASKANDIALPYGQLTFERQLDEVGQPFRLMLKTQNGVTGFDLVLGMALLLLSVCLGWFYYQNSYRRYLSNVEREQALHDLAEEREGLEQRVIERTEALNIKTEEIRQLANKLVNLQEDDYRYIARELHDEFGQLITAIGINTKLVANRMGDDTDASELSEETKLLVDQLHTAIHSLIGRLRPETLDTFGLVVSIQHCIELFKLREQGIDQKLDVDPAIDQLPDNHAIAVYRVIQELVNNAVKHAKPSMITIVIQVLNNQVSIHVDDNGVGMDVKNRPKGFGLHGLNERVIALNGVMQINSVPGNGCCVSVSLPIECVAE